MYPCFGRRQRATSLSSPIVTSNVVPSPSVTSARYASKSRYSLLELFVRMMLLPSFAQPSTGLSFSMTGTFVMDSAILQRWPLSSRRTPNPAVGDSRLCGSASWS